jgi:ATPase subunit of ABC transporter with duplicated ATPase domains
MTLLSTQGLGLAFGVREIFSGINVNLTAGDKVGLVIRTAPVRPPSSGCWPE